ncbi:MAG TPA: hypothetical protein VF796_05230, partial [Humisphaera sp.]
HTSLTLKSTKISGPLMKLGGFVLRPVDAPAIGPGADGAIVLGSRAATLAGDAIWLDHNGRISDVRTGATAEWKVGVAKAGTYEVELNQSSTSPGDFELTVGGQRLAGAVAVTGDWARVERTYVGAVRLKEGPTTLVLRAVKARGSLMNLLEVKLIPTEKPRPAPQAVANAGGPPIAPPAARPPVVRPPDPAVRPNANTPPALPPAKPPVAVRPPPRPQLPQPPIHPPPALLKPRLAMAVKARPTAAVFSADGRLVFAATDDAVTRVYDAATGAERPPLALPPNRSVRAMAPSPDRKTLAVAGEFEEIKLLNGTTGAEVASWPAGSVTLLGVSSLAWSADGRRLASCAGKRLVVWDPAARAAVCTAELPPNANDAKAAAFSPDGATLAALIGAENPAHEQVTLLAFYDPATGKLRRSVEFPYGPRWLRFLRPDLVLMSKPSGAGMVVVDTVTGKVADNYFGEHTAISAALSPDGRLLANGSAGAMNDTEALVWDTASGLCVGRMTGENDDVVSVAFSPDGKSIVTAAHDKAFRVYDAPPPSPNPTDYKAVSARLVGRWSASPPVDERRVQAMVKARNVPPEQQPAAVAATLKAMEGYKVTYAFAADGTVTCTMASGGRSQDIRGRWEVLSYRGDFVIRVRVTAEKVPPDLLTIYMKYGQQDEFEMTMVDVPVRQPLKFEREK